MARYHAIYDENGKIYEEVDGNVVIDTRNKTIEAGYYVVGDISPYQSMVDGKMIEGRKQHREMLKKNHLVEVGNEVKHLKPFGKYESPKGIKETLIREFEKAKSSKRH